MPLICRLLAVKTIGDAVAELLSSASGTVTKNDNEADPENRDDDAYLFESYCNGNDHAFRLLFEKWKLPLISFFYRSLGNREVAEDLTLDVFNRLHRAKDRYKRSAKFSTYLFFIARRQLINELRKRKRKPLDFVDPADMNYLATEAHSTAQITKEQEQAITFALDKLDEKEKTPLLLVLQQGLKPQEISKIIGKSEGSTRVFIHRAKVKLKQILEESL